MTTPDAPADLKTVAELVDELSITNCKLFALVERAGDWRAAGLSAEQAADNQQKIQTLNAHRSRLKNALDRRLGSGRQEVKV